MNIPHQTVYDAMGGLRVTDRDVRKEGVCDKCGLGILGGAAIWCCRFATECTMWPHSDGSPEGDGAELLMCKLWMGNALEQIGLQIEDRKALEAKCISLSNERHRVDLYTATFQIKELHSGEFKVEVVAPNGDTCCWTPKGERGQRVLKAARAALNEARQEKP